MIGQAALAPGARLPASWAGLLQLRELKLLDLRIGGPLPGCEWARPGCFPSLESL